MMLFDEDVKITKTVLYPLDRSSRRGINKFGILLSDYDSYEDYKKALKKVCKRLYRSLPSFKDKRNASRRNPEYREKHKLYLREWRTRDPELAAIRRFKDNTARKKANRLRKLKADNLRRII